jgi:hypothetical protein
MRKTLDTQRPDFSNVGPKNMARTIFAKCRLVSALDTVELVVVIYMGEIM